MKLKFTKMHGAGNDYIYFNAFEQNISNPNKLSEIVSDRRFGIGGDGIILICPSDVADAKMRMFNADGSEGKMCGNAIRCVGKYIYDNGIVSKDRDEVFVETLSGIKKLSLFVENGEVVQVLVDMDKAILKAADIPCISDSETVINKEIEVNGENYFVTCVSMGNPHCITFVDDVDGLDLEKIGPHFEFHKMFPDRVNTEFAKVVDKNTIQMRVWERGSGETWACGTGACATAVAAVENGLCDKGEDIKLILRGGTLTIKYTDDTVFMTGPATKVFDGEIDIEGV